MIGKVGESLRLYLKTNKTNICQKAQKDSQAGREHRRPQTRSSQLDTNWALTRMYPICKQHRVCVSFLLIPLTMDEVSHVTWWQHCQAGATCPASVGFWLAGSSAAAPPHNLVQHSRSAISLILKLISWLSFLGCAPSQMDQPFSTQLVVNSGKPAQCMGAGARWHQC